MRCLCRVKVIKGFPMLPLPVEDAFDRVAVDILGPLKHSNHRTKSLNCSF